MQRGPAQVGDGAERDCAGDIAGVGHRARVIDHRARRAAARAPELEAGIQDELAKHGGRVGDAGGCDHRRVSRRRADRQAGSIGYSGDRTRGSAPVGSVSVSVTGLDSPAASAISGRSAQARRASQATRRR